MMTKRLLVVLALAVLMLGAPVAAQPAADAADLGIQQPDYIDSEVQQTSDNGTTVYQVRGSPIDIAPKNFDGDDVVDYGVATDGGDAQLTYNEEFETFQLTASQNGSYDLYWSVEENVAVTNGTTNETRTETRQRRYQATIQIKGQTDMEHLPAGSRSAQREDAQKWREFNATVQQLREKGGFLTDVMVDLGLQEPPTTDDIIQGMVNAWLTVNRPLEMLTGNFSSMVLISTTTLGGWLFMLFLAGPLIATIGFLYYRYNVKESVEADEGKLKTNIARYEEEKNQRAAANKKFNQIWSDDHVAGAMSEEGRNPVDAAANWFSKIRDRFFFHARLQAMDQTGYVAVVDEEVSTDGGDGSEDSEILDAHVAKKSEVDDDEETISLDVAPEHELIDALDWAQDEIREFDLVGAEFDREDVQTPVELYDMKELAKKMDVDAREFDDYTVAAEYMAEFFEDVRQHPLTDDRGVPDTLRWCLEQHLDAANLLADRFEMPIQYRKEAFERALVEHDTTAEAEETMMDIREGAYA